VALFTTCLAWPAIVSASPSSALREYKAGKYGEALREYQRLLQSKTNDMRLRFNAATLRIAPRSMTRQ